MAILFDAPVEPDALTTFIREVPVPSELALLAAAGERFEADNTIDWADVTQTNRTARYRSYDGRIHVSARDAAEERRVKLIPLSSSLSMGEYERLQLEFARTGGSRLEALAQAIYNDGLRLTREVQYRLEQAIGDVLTDGRLTINENGFQGEADFGVPAAQLVAPAIAWSDTANATVLTDLIAWHDVMTGNGVIPGALRTSNRVARLMQRNTEIINAVHGSASGRTRVNRDDLNDLLVSEGLPPVADTYDTVVDVDGTTTRTIPDDRLLFTPTSLSDLVQVVTGVSATALELVESNQVEFSFEDAPGIVGVVEKIGPPYREFTFVDAVAMPILTDAKRLLVADVA
jgi:hypothetical protein